MNKIPLTYLGSKIQFVQYEGTKAERTISIFVLQIVDGKYGQYIVLADGEQCYVDGLTNIRVL